MNKSKILPALVIGVLILCEAFGIIYFANKTQNFSRKNQDLTARIESFQPGYTRMSHETEDARAKYEGAKRKYDEIADELAVVKADRENVLAQTKTLLAGRARAQELEEEMAKVKSGVQTIEDEKKKLKEQNLGLKTHIRKLKDDFAKLTAERDELKATSEKLQNNTLAQELNDKIADLQKELKSSVVVANAGKAEIELALKVAEKKVDQLTVDNGKLAAAKDELAAKVEAQKNDYADAVKKNKALDQEIRQLPGKFVEISRQNKVLLQQTEGMHYNMGVFYTKHKEYDRAVAEFLKAVEIKPDDAYAHFNLGYIYAEHLVNRPRAVEHFRHFLRMAKGNDPDVNWARKYLLTWETFEGKRPMQ